MQNSQGIHEVLLTGGDFAYQVAGAGADIFYARISDGGFPVNRVFLYTAEEGELLFARSGESISGDYVLVAVGHLGARLEKLESGSLSEIQLAMFAEYSSKLLSSLKNAYSQMMVADVEDVFLREWRWAEKDKFYHDFLMLVRQEDGLNRYINYEKLVERKDLDKEMMGKSIKSLASFDSAEAIVTDTILPGADDWLWKACLKVAAVRKIDLRFPPKDLSGNMLEKLDLIMRFSHVKYRKVTLTGVWWKDDNGPLICFVGDDMAPAALLPHGTGSYDLWMENETVPVKVTEQIAATIRAQAFMLYRPLPSHSLGLVDMLKFFFQSIHKMDLLVVMVTGIAGGAVSTVIPIANGILFDSVIPQGIKSTLFQAAVVLFSIFIANFVFQILSSLAMLRVEGYMSFATTASIIDRMLSLPVSFFRIYNAGELASRVQGIEMVRQMLMGTVMGAMLTAVFSFMNLFVIFRFGAGMAAIGLLLGLFSSAVSCVIGILQLRYERKIVKADNDLSSFLFQMLRGINKFRMSFSENRAFYMWSMKQSKKISLTYRSQKLQSLSTSFNAFFPMLCSLVLFSQASLLLSGRNITVGEFIAFNSAFGIFIGAITTVTTLFFQISSVIPMYENTKPLLKNIPEYDEEKEDPGVLDGGIEVNAVDFRYSEDSPMILKKVSFFVRPGEYVAVVGSSGSGKSTLLRLLLGFEKPESGSVYYGDQDLTNVDVRAVRRQLGVVLQNGQLMAGDILSNIIMGNPSLGWKEAMEAAKMAGLEDDINQMPMGVFTVISEGASTISGGQKQRILIARALVNRPKIIFFDEATSALDNRTQDIVSKSLEKLNSTRVVIAHRLSTVRHCDRIVVLEQGQVVEIGNFDELMNIEDGYFRKMAERQIV